MADTSNYNKPFKRRKEQKTDYEQRLKLIKSEHPRAVIRTSNKHTRVQIADYKPEGDKNSAQTTSKELREYGWEHNTGNIPAAYLTGYLAGHRAETKKAILDIGLRKQKRKGRIFAAVKGMQDAGVEVPTNPEAIPTEERITGKHIEQMKDIQVTQDFEKTKEKIESSEK